MKNSYVLNLNSKVVHKLPTREPCNMDQCKRKKKFTQWTPELRQRNKCGHCFEGPF